MHRTYPSKIDAWLGAVLALASLVVLAAIAAVLQQPGVAPWVIAPLLFLVGVCLPASLLLATRYTLTDTTLHIRSGLFSWRVAVAEITGVEPTRNPLSSPALSLDRLLIRYGPGRSVMISPRDREDFLQALEGCRRRAAGQAPP